MAVFKKGIAHVSRSHSCFADPSHGTDRHDIHCSNCREEEETQKAAAEFPVKTPGRLSGLVGIFLYYLYHPLCPLDGSN
jgi:hypothetical protein